MYCLFKMGIFQPAMFVYRRVLNQISTFGKDPNRTGLQAVRARLVDVLFVSPERWVRGFCWDVHGKDHEKIHGKLTDWHDVSRYLQEIEVKRLICVCNIYIYIYTHYVIAIASFFTNMSCLRITICNMYFIFLATAMTPHSKSQCKDLPF